MEIKKRIRDYISRWEKKGYKNGIPDEAPVQLEKRGLVPSYRMICIALMRNPNNLESLGFPREKCRIYQEIKREEIRNRKKENEQLRLPV